MNFYTTTRLILLSLVFSFLCNSCHNDQPGEISIVWKDQKAVQLVIQGNHYGNTEEFEVFLTPGNNPPILGRATISDAKIIFEPFIPLTRGLTYRVMLNGKLVDSIKIPPPSSSEKTEVIAVHPSNGVIPENLLKMYIEFSRPMKEGESLKHIAMIKNKTDTLSDIFLDLQPELWNDDRTILTIWLDPGRIKRGLQPNLKLGPPLIKDGSYTFLIRDDWEAADGNKLQNSFKQDYFTTIRDSLSPDPSKWTMNLPKPGTTDSLVIHFGESLDYMVAMNAIHVLNEENKEVPGKTLLVYPKEDVLSFIPELPWQKGNYTIMVDSKLEDNAGNNLDHPFDNDITQPKNRNTGKGYKRKIMIN